MLTFTLAAKRPILTRFRPCHIFVRDIEISRDGGEPDRPRFVDDIDIWRNGDTESAIAYAAHHESDARALIAHVEARPAPSFMPPSIAMTPGSAATSDTERFDGAVFVKYEEKPRKVSPIHGLLEIGARCRAEAERLTLAARSRHIIKTA